MSLGYWQTKQIYLCREPIDMRKGSNSLAMLVDQELGLNPLQDAMFAFINKSRDKVKLLVWHSNGFWLLSKNLLRERFKWPKWFNEDTIILSEEQLLQLLDGIDLNGLRPHKKIMIQHLG